MPTPTQRIIKKWPSVPGGKRTGIEAALFGFAILYYIRGVIMGKSSWPRIALLLISVAYSVFVLVFFRGHPEITAAAFFILGGVLFSIFVISLFTGGKRK